MNKDAIENEFLSILLLARKKGMSSRQFFSLVEETLKHMKGTGINETLSKIIDGTATSDEVDSMLSHLK